MIPKKVRCFILGCNLTPRPLVLVSKYRVIRSYNIVFGRRCTCCGKMLGSINDDQLFKMENIQFVARLYNQVVVPWFMFAAEEEKSCNV